jgi:hypothetical protein
MIPTVSPLRNYVTERALDLAMIESFGLGQSLAGEQREHDLVAIKFQPDNHLAVALPRLPSRLPGERPRRIELAGDVLQPAAAFACSDTRGADHDAGKSFVGKGEHAPL